MNVANEVVLLIGKTGAGKSTLGNLLLGKPHNNGPFCTSASFNSVTDNCSSATMSIDGIDYDVVDTPGIFDTKRESNEILKKISGAVNQCAYGVKAILIVLETRRFTQEQREVLNEIRKFLGRDATNHIIAVFSHANGAQTERKDIMQNDWNDDIKSFIQIIGNRWSISPNPEMFPPENNVHRERLNEIKKLIKRIREVYTTEQLERNLREQEEARRQKEEEERRKKQEHEEKIREDARKNAAAIYERQIKSMKRALESQAREQSRLMNELIKNLSSNDISPPKCFEGHELGEGSTLCGWYCDVCGKDNAGTWVLSENRCDICDFDACSIHCQSGKKCRPGSYCKNGHPLHHSSYTSFNWECDVCKRSYSLGECRRFRCDKCNYDKCMKCW